MNRNSVLKLLSSEPYTPNESTRQLDSLVSSGSGGGKGFKSPLKGGVDGVGGAVVGESLFVGAPAGSVVGVVTIDDGVAYVGFIVDPYVGLPFVGIVCTGAGTGDDGSGDKVGRCVGFLVGFRLISGII